MSDFSDDELERLAEHFEQRAKASIAAEAEAIAAEPADVVVPDGHVVFYGFDGQVDAVMRIPEPRPDVLLMPIRRRLSLRIEEELDAKPTPLPNARYNRIGDFTYERVS